MGFASLHPSYVSYVTTLLAPWLDAYQCDPRSNPATLMSSSISGQ